MLLPDPRIEVLRGLGLTDYQARAYASLARLGRATATHLARAAGVPRNKLYHTLEELNALGLVETRLGEVQTFAALPIRSLLDARRRMHDEAMRSVEAQRAQIEAMFPLRSEDAAGAATHAVVHGRAAGLAQLARAIEGAERELLIVGGPATAQLMLARGLGQALAQRVREGVVARVVVPFAPGSDEAVRSLDALLGGGVRVTEQPLAGVIALVADARVAVQMEEWPAAGAGREVCLVSDAPVVGQTLAHAGRSLWALSYPAPAPGAHVPGAARPALCYQDFAPEVAAAFARATRRVDASFASHFAPTAVRDFLAAAAGATARGVEVRVLAEGDPGAARAPSLEAMIAAGVQVRTLREPPAVGFAVFDAAFALIGVSSDDFDGASIGSFGGLAVHNATIAGAMAHAFDAAWDAADRVVQAAQPEAVPARSSA